MTPLISHLIVAILFFVIGIFVYRNNVDLISPLGDKLDDKFDELEERLKNELKK